ncbi:hypothetical protein BKA18_003850 [Streptomyces auratus]
MLLFGGCTAPAGTPLGHRLHLAGRVWWCMWQSDICQSLTQMNAVRVMSSDSPRRSMPSRVGQLLRKREFTAIRGERSAPRLWVPELA